MIAYQNAHKILNTKKLREVNRLFKIMNHRLNYSSQPVQHRHVQYIEISDEQNQQQQQYYQQKKKQVSSQSKYYQAFCQNINKLTKQKISFDYFQKLSECQPMDIEQPEDGSTNGSENSRKDYGEECLQPRKRQPGELMVEESASEAEFQFVEEEETVRKESSSGKTKNIAKQSKKKEKKVPNQKLRFLVKQSKQSEQQREDLIPKNTRQKAAKYRYLHSDTLNVIEDISQRVDYRKIHQVDQFAEVYDFQKKSFGQRRVQILKKKISLEIRMIKKLSF